MNAMSLFMRHSPSSLVMSQLQAKAGKVWRKITSVFPTRRVKPDCSSSSASPDPSAAGGNLAPAPAAAPAAVAAEVGSPSSSAASSPRNGAGPGRQSFTRRLFGQSRAFWQQRRGACSSPSGKEGPPASPHQDTASSKRARGSQEAPPSNQSAEMTAKIAPAQAVTPTQAEDTSRKHRRHRFRAEPNR